MDNHSNANRCLSPIPAAISPDTQPAEDLLLSERIAFAGAHPHDWPFIAPILHRFPERIACALARRYRAIASSTGRFEANTYLREQIPIADSAGIALRADDDKVRDLANDYSSLALRSIMGLFDEAEQYEHLARYCTTKGIEAPEPNDHKGGTWTRPGCIKRMTNRHWWLKRLRAKLQQERESLMIRYGLVMKRKDLYCSREALRDYEDQTKRNAQILANTHITDGQNTLSLADVAATTVANPEVRYAELMTRLRGLEELAKASGQAMMFITVTCPSRMHSFYRDSGQPNPNYDHTTPKEAHQYLQTTWQRARAELGREGIQLEGFRIAEPHHDECPHWHLALAVDPTRADDLMAIIEDYFTQENPEDKGIKNRVKVEHVHTSLAGYLGKYISKNIDGAHVDTDFNGEDAKTSAKRVRAWASTWGIRQFQPIGGASVTVWRELRRVRDAAEVPEAIRPVWEAADRGDWAAYTTAQGGFNTAKDSHLVKLAKLWNEQPNRYGEAMGWQVIGVEAEDSYLNTRPKEWTVVAGCTQQIESLTRALADAGGKTPESIAHYEAYAAELNHGTCPPSLALRGGENALPGVPPVQLFSRGQAGDLTAPVAPTGAEKRCPNAPPDPESPPVWAYDDHQTAETGYPEASPCPDDYDAYAASVDASATTGHEHVA